MRRRCPLGTWSLPLAPWLVLLLGAGADDRSLVVLTAASINDAVAEIAREYEQDAPCRVLVSAGASGALRRQIELGAPCDVFLSADPRHIDELLRRRRGPTPAPRTVARNRLVVAAHQRDADALPRAQMPKALDSAIVRRIAIASPDYAPAGAYAKQALEHAGLWAGLQPKLVLADDVRAAAKLAQLRTVDAAIIYASDAGLEPELSVRYTFPPEAHEPIVYTAAALSDRSEGRAFVDFLASEQAVPTWNRFGFEPAYANDGAATGTRRAVETSAPAPVSSFSGDLAAIALSMRVALVSVLLMALPAIGLASWLARTRSRWRMVVEVLTMMPLVMPPVVTGLLLLVALQRLPLPILFTWWAAALASAVVSAPLLIRTARSAIEAVDPRLAQVAATLGASRLRILWRIQYPLAWRGIVSGALLAWARALGEFGATIVVAGNVPGRTRTIPLAVWTAIQSPSGGGVALLLVGAVGLSIAAVVVSEFLVRRRR